MALGSLLKVLSQSTGYNFSWQLNYNAVATLLQVLFCERRIVYVHFKSKYNP